MKALWKWMGLCLTLSALTAASPAAAETTATPDTVKTGWWILGLESSNNSSFFGRNTARRYPYAAATVTYVHNTGLWASATSYQLFNTEDYIDETDLSLGYSFKIRKRLEVDLSYSHFIFGENTPLVKSGTTDALSARAAYDWKYLYSALTASYIIGSGNDIFTVLENSRYLPLNTLWKGNIPVGLDPKLSIIAGTQRFSETHTTTTRQKNTAGGGNNTGSNPIGGGILGPLNPGGSSGKPSSGTPEETTTTTTTTTTVSRFKVLNYDLKIPVVVYVGKFEFEPSWRYSIPVNKIEGDESKAQSFYTVSVKYTF